MQAGDDPYRACIGKFKRPCQWFMVGVIIGALTGLSAASIEWNRILCQLLRARLLFYLHLRF